MFPDVHPEAILTWPRPEGGVRRVSEIGIEQYLAVGGRSWAEPARAERATAGHILSLLVRVDLALARGSRFLAS
jgi:hypothetical protein